MYPWIHRQTDSSSFSKNHHPQENKNRNNLDGLQMLNTSRGCTWPTATPPGQYWSCLQGGRCTNTTLGGAFFFSFRKALKWRPWGEARKTPG